MMVGVSVLSIDKPRLSRILRLLVDTIGRESSTGRGRSFLRERISRGDVKIKGLKLEPSSNLRVEEDLPLSSTEESRFYTF